jgi:hypothetical protein
MPATLTSQRYKVESLDAAMELCYAKGWSDGLPVVPPTEPAVRAMLEAGGLAPDAEVAYLSQRAVGITAEKVAINAVMAGCKPEYMPVVVAAVEGIGDPRWSYHGPGTASSTSTPATTSSGPAGVPTSPSAARCAWSCATWPARCPDSWIAAPWAIPASSRT